MANDLAVSLNSKFVELYEEKHYDEAEEVIKQAVEACPTHTDSLFNYATFLQEVKQEYELADDFFQKAIASNPNDSTILGSYALFQRSCKRNNSKAEEYYLKALKINPSDTGLLNTFAQFLKDSQQYDRAEEYFEKAIESNPTNANTLNNYAQFLKAIRKDYEKAEQFYLKAIDANPKHAFALNNYAQFLKDVKRAYVSAEEYFQRALEANPNHIDILYNFALFMVSIKKDYKRGEEAYIKALQTKPNHTFSLLNYANLLAYIKKDEDTAEQYYLRAIKSDQSYVDSYINYTTFLINIRKDYSLAEDWLTKAGTLNAKQDKIGILLDQIRREREKEKKKLAKTVSSPDLEKLDRPYTPGGSPPKMSPYSPTNGRKTPQLLPVSSASALTPDKLREAQANEEIPHALRPGFHPSSRGGTKVRSLEPIQNNSYGMEETRKVVPELDEIQVDLDGRGQNNGAMRGRASSMAELSQRTDDPDAMEFNIKQLCNPYILYNDPKTGKDMKHNIEHHTTNIGRKEDNDMILMSKYVSRYHCRIDMEVRNGVTVLVFKDLSERSRINGEKPIDHVLVKGDQIKLGKTLLLFLDKSDRPLLASPTKEGPGWKQSTSLLAYWQSQYFVLHRHVLYFFKNQKERTSNQLPAGMIDIDGCTIEKEDELTFTIDSNKKQFHLKFQPAEVKDEWLEAIRQISKQKK